MLLEVVTLHMAPDDFLVRSICFQRRNYRSDWPACKFPIIYVVINCHFLPTWILDGRSDEEYPRCAGGRSRRGVEPKAWRPGKGECAGETGCCAGSIVCARPSCSGSPWPCVDPLTPARRRCFHPAAACRPTHAARRWPGRGDEHESRSSSRRATPSLRRGREE